MRKLTFCGLAVLLITTNGCAIVPDLESEDTFSYSEIVTQIECELYQASERLRLKIDADDHNQAFTFEPAQWVATIQLQPDVALDAQANIGAAFQANLTKNYFKWALGGGTATATGVEINGDANANNQYSLSLSNLYFDKSDLSEYKYSVGGAYPKVSAHEVTYYDQISNDISEVFHNIADESVSTKDVPAKIFTFLTTTDRIGLISDNPAQRIRLIHPKLHNQCRFNNSTPGQVGDPTIYPAEIGGVFGLDNFMQRSLAAMESGTVDVTQFQMAKWYKLNILAGGTIGWYVPLGSYGPNLGGSKKFNNIITIIMKKATPNKPTFEYVCLVGGPKDVACRKPIGGNLVEIPPTADSGHAPPLHPLAAGPVRRASGPRLAIQKNAVSPYDVDFMSKSLNSGTNSQLLKQLQQ